MPTKLYNQENKKDIRRSLRKSMPKGERYLWYRLKANKQGYKFRRQYSIGKYIVDLYCPKLKLVIEVDGFTHNFPDQIKHDKERQKYLESLGIKIKRFLSDDIFEDLDYVVRQIGFLCEKLDKERDDKDDFSGKSD